MVQELGGAPRTRVGQEVTAPRMRGRAVSPPAVTACAGGGDRCGPDRARPAPRRRHRSRLPNEGDRSDEGGYRGPTCTTLRRVKVFFSRTTTIHTRGGGEIYIREARFIQLATLAALALMLF